MFFSGYYLWKMRIGYIWKCCTQPSCEDRCGVYWFKLIDPIDYRGIRAKQVLVSLVLGASRCSNCWYWTELVAMKGELLFLRILCTTILKVFLVQLILLPTLTMATISLAFNSILVFSVWFEMRQMQMLKYSQPGRSIVMSTNQRDLFCALASVTSIVRQSGCRVQRGGCEW